MAHFYVQVVIWKWACKVRLVQKSGLFKMVLEHIKMYVYFLSITIKNQWNLLDY